MTGGAPRPEDRAPRSGRARRDDRVVRRLDARAASRPAHEFLAEIPWEGVRLDPQATAAGVFLANL